MTPRYRERSYLAGLVAGRDPAKEPGAGVLGREGHAGGG